MALRGESLKKFLARLFCDSLFFVLVSLAAGLTFTTYFPPHKRGFFCDDRSLKLPYKSYDTVPTVTLITVTVALPIAIMIVGEMMCTCCGKTSSPIHHHMVSPAVSTNRCVNCARTGIHVLTFCYGYDFTALFVGVSKSVLGYQRPHFFDVCKPDFDKLNCSDGFISDYECQSTDQSLIRHAMMSFPSGHSSQAAYSAIFILLYIEFRRHVMFGCGRAAGISHKVPLVTVQGVFLLLALYVGYTRIIDHKHHWQDVLTGYLLGAAGAGITFVKVSDFPATSPSWLGGGGRGVRGKRKSSTASTRYMLAPSGAAGEAVSADVMTSDHAASDAESDADESINGVSVSNRNQPTPRAGTQLNVMC